MAPGGSGCHATPAEQSRPAGSRLRLTQEEKAFLFLRFKSLRTFCVLNFYIKPYSCMPAWCPARGCPAPRPAPRLVQLRAGLGEVRAGRGQLVPQLFFLSQVFFSLLLRSVFFGGTETYGFATWGLRPVQPMLWGASPTKTDAFGCFAK